MYARLLPSLCSLPIMNRDILFPAILFFFFLENDILKKFLFIFNSFMYLFLAALGLHCDA